MIRKLNVAVALFFAMCLVSAMSRAEDFQTRAETQVVTNPNERGYGYVFHDDPLNAGDGGSMAASIIVRPKAGHALLIRPRMQFVTEMLKSVENL